MSVITSTTAKRRFRFPSGCLPSGVKAFASCRCGFVTSARASLPRPSTAAVGHAGTDEIAHAAQGVNAVAINGGGAARTVAVTILHYAACNFFDPDFLAAIGVEGDETLGGVANAHRKQPSFDDGRGGIAISGILENPEALGAARRPFLEQAGLLRNIAPGGPEPRGPVESPDRDPSWGRGERERLVGSGRERCLVGLAGPGAREGGGDLTRVNELFTGWVETVAHSRVHSETGQRPLERFLAPGPPPFPPRRAHGWVVRHGGAQRASSRIARMVASGTGSGL